MAEEQNQKIGQGHLKAFIRQGHKEIAQVLQAFPSGPVHPVEEPGLIGNLTPQEVAQDKGMQQSYQSVLNGYAVHGKSEPQRQVPER